MEVTPEVVLERVRAAGGRLVLEGMDEDSLAAWLPGCLAAWRRAAKVAQLRLLRAGPQRLRSWSTPEKVMLLLAEVDGRGSEVPRAAPAEPSSRTWVPPPRPRPRTQEFLGRVVPVPSSLRRPHPIVDELTEAVDFPDRVINLYRSYPMPSSRRPMQRMRKIWQAIITEAQFRGYEVEFRHYRRDHYDRGQLVLRIDWDEFPLELYGERGTPLRLTIKERHPTRRRGYDSWTDSPDKPLHGQLGEIFTHIERWADLLIAQREAEDRRQEQRRRERERQEADARRRFTEDHRRRTLRTRMGDRRFAADARAYVAALTAVADGLEADRAEGVRAWAAWILDHADQLDARVMREGMPAAPKPDRDDLRPYLPAGRWF
jgi:hypothetical protein